MKKIHDKKISYQKNFVIKYNKRNCANKICINKLWKSAFYSHDTPKGIHENRLLSRFEDTGVGKLSYVCENNFSVYLFIVKLPENISSFSFCLFFCSYHKFEKFSLSYIRNQRKIDKIIFLKIKWNNNIEQVYIEKFPFFLLCFSFSQFSLFLCYRWFKQFQDFFFSFM